MADDEKSKPVTITMEPAQLAELDAWAAAERRTRSNAVALLVAEALSARRAITVPSSARLARAARG